MVTVRPSAWSELFSDPRWSSAGPAASDAAPLWCLDRAIEAASMAALAYHERDVALRQLAASRGVTASHWDVGSSRVLVAESGGVAWVSIAGSNDPADWRSNLAAWRRRSRVLPDYGRVHAGFARELELIWDPVWSWLELVPHRCVVVTGHSRGGSVASLLAAAVREHAVAPVWCFTWSSPRAFGRDGAARYHSGVRLPVPTYRVVPTSSAGLVDLVTRVPRRWWGYSHVGLPVVLGSDARVYPSLEAWKRARERTGSVSALAEWRILSRLASSVAAHSLGSTIELLQRAAAAAAVAE